MRKALAVVLLVTACGGDGIGAVVACEEFVERRVGSEVEFAAAADYNEVEAGVWRVVGQFDDGEGTTTYGCEVVRDDDGWTLADLSTDR